SASLAISSMRALFARVSLVALGALRTLQIRAIDTIHNNGGAIPGNLGRVPVCTVGPVLAGVALRALSSLSSARLFNTVQLGSRNRRAASLPVLPLIRFKCHQFPPPG